MKKQGFTLAEVLITLGIVGIVAAVSLPVLTANIQKQQIGPALAKALNTLESSTKTLLAQQGASSNLGSICGEQQLMACLDGNGVLSASLLESSDNSSTYVTKDGIAFIQLGAASASNNDSLNVRKYHPNHYDIAVDVNGINKKPNTYDKDKFRFIVDFKGNVLAMGSTEYSNYVGTNFIYKPREGKPPWQSYCAKSTEIPAALGLGGIGMCTAAIIENGYKVTYDWDNIPEDDNNKFTGLGYGSIDDFKNAATTIKDPSSLLKDPAKLSDLSSAKKRF